MGCISMFSHTGGGIDVNVHGITKKQFENLIPVFTKPVRHIAAPPTWCGEIEIERNTKVIFWYAGPADEIFRETAGNAGEMGGEAAAGL